MRNKYKTFLQIALRSLAIVGTTGLHAANSVWLGTTDNLDTPSNWSNGLPNSNTIAEFNSTGSANTDNNTNGFSALGLLFDASSTTGYGINIISGDFNIGLSGVVNNSSYTQVIGNDTGGVSNIIFAGGSSGDNINYYSANGATGGGITFLTSTNVNGAFVLDNNSTLTSNGDSSVGSLYLQEAGGPIIGNNNVVIASGSLTIGSLNLDDYIYGPISGPGKLIYTTTTDNGYLGLAATNTYTGGTVVNGTGTAGLYITSGGTLAPTGTVEVNSGSFGIYDSSQTIGNLSGAGGYVFIESPYTLTVNQTSNETYAGVISGTSSSSFGNFTLGTTGSTTALGTLQLTGDSSAFAGDVNVNSGNLQVNGFLGNGTTFDVNSGGTLSGTGTVGRAGGQISINSGGTVSPGNSVGVLTTPGSFTFGSGSIYRLEENGYTTGPITPSIDLLLVGESAVILDATVDLVTTNENINFNTRQAFLTGGNPLTVGAGGFTLNTSGLLPIFNPNAFTSSLSYDTNNYYILTQTQFLSEVTDLGGNATAHILASYFDQISDPTTPQNLILNGLAKLSGPALLDALNVASGAQYVTEVFLTEVSNRQFIRRLYDPLREIVTREPCCACYPIDPCQQRFGLDIWAEAGAGQKRVNGYTGITVSDWDVTLGAQTTFRQDWTVGIAGSYEHHDLKYHVSNGHGNGYTWFGGVYGLYRPSCFYVLADLAYGYTQHHIHRQFVTDSLLSVSKFEAKAKTSQVTFYAEAGLDQVLFNILVQPFVGIEAAGFNRQGFSERDLSGSGLALNIRKKDHALATSSLGVHLTDQYFCNFNLSLDLAWLYRLTNDVHFRGSLEAFGPDFDVYGRRIGRSSAQGALTFSTYILNNTKAYVVGSGEIWSEASLYNVVGGLQYTW